jgi:ATP-binding cassette subfamily B protein RaxB
MTETYFEILKNKLNLTLNRRVPQILQTEASECGLACLAMVCHYHGLQIDLFNLRSRYGYSSRGATLSALMDIAGALKLQSRALSLNIDELRALKMPCILHWDMKHFVVLVSVSRRRAVIHDPAFGRKVMELHELSRHFTGVALELTPDNEFQPIKQQSRLRFRKLMSNVRGLKSALLKIFCLSIIIEAVNLLLPVGTQLVMDHVILAGDHDLLALICIGLLFFILFRACVSMLRAWISIVMGSLIDVQWKAGVFEHLMKLPLSFFEKRKLGDIQSRFGSLDTIRTTFTTSIVSSIIDGIMSVGVFIMMLLYGGWLVWVVLGFTAAYITLRLSTYQYYRQLSEEQLVKAARAGSHFMESLYSISTLKALGLSAIRSQYWLNLTVETINAGIKLTKLNMMFGGFGTFIATCDQIIILWLGAALVIDNEMTLGMFVAFNAYRGQFSERASSLIDMMLQLRMLSLHNERIADIVLSSPEQQMPARQLFTKGKAVALQIRNLRYQYDRLTKPVVSDLNLDIAAGESVAIIGPSGVGKTTLMKLMCGLLTPDSGSIMVDGMDISSIGVNNYRQCIACVLQDDKLLAGSIAEKYFRV